MPSMGTGGRSLFNSPEMEAREKEFTDACLVNRVIVHAFDIYNSMDQHKRSASAEFKTVTPGFRDIYRDYNYQVSSGIRDAADFTGGTFSQAFGLTTPMTRVIDRGRYYYLFGYTSPDGRKGKWRKLKVKCKRKGVKLEHRSGYFGK